MIVLKILLILMLCFAVIILLLLFFPIQYRVHGKAGDRFQVFADVRWLIAVIFLRVSFDTETKAVKAVLRVFGIPIKLDPKKRREKVKKKRKEPLEKESRRKNKKAAPKEDTGEHSGGNPSEESRKAEEKTAKKPSKLQKIGPLLKELQDQHNKEALKHIFSELSNLRRLLWPKRMRADLMISLGDPARTGELLAVLSFVPFLYQKGVRILPDFTADKAYAKGTFSLNGHFMLASLVVMGIRILKDKKVRRLIKRIRAL